MTAQNADAVETASSIRTGAVSAVEVVQAAIARIEKLNPALNAVVHTRFEQALDETRRGLPDGPLRGVPMLVKDLGIEVAGLPITRGSRLFADVVAHRDSTLAARYRRAGMVVLGSTNSPELGKNASTEPVLYGPTRNPWNPRHSTGGSSGGSAAAVASGMVPVAHATDGGGSIRIPAAMCGLFGLKPGRGVVPLRPYPSALASPLTAPHAVTTTVRDSAALLDVSAGPTPGDAFGAPAPPTSYSALLRRRGARLRIGMATTTADGTAADPECADAVERAAALCQDLGHEVAATALDYDSATAMRAFSILMGADLLDTVDTRLEQLGRRLSEDDLEPFTHAVLEHARSLTARQVHQALATAQEIGWQVGGLLEQYDVLLTPTLARTTPALGVLDTTDVSAMYDLGTRYSAFTSICNLTGQPAMSVPFGADGAGLPLGVQFVADLGGEGTLLSLAAELEEAAPWQRTASCADAPTPGGAH